jgi:hypothetical protein
VKISTKGHNSVKFGCSENSFLYYHLHIKVVHPCKLKQNLPSGLRGVAFTRFRDGRTSATLYAPTLWGHKNSIEKVENLLSSKKEEIKQNISNPLKM